MTVFERLKGIFIKSENGASTGSASKKRGTSKHNQNKKKKNVFTIPRRAAWYIVRNVLIIGVVVFATFFAFLMAMHSANVYIIVTEGFTLRTACILGQADPNEMYEYFTSDFVDSDTGLSESIYRFYDVVSFDYRLSVNAISLWPFDTTATMTVTERIPTISGSANADAPSAAVPEWTAGRYVVSCIKNDGRWYISSIKLEMENPPANELPTPDMSLLTPSPTPVLTPTPAILPESSVSPSPVPTE